MNAFHEGPYVLKRYKGPGLLDVDTIAYSCAEVVV